MFNITTLRIIRPEQWTKNIFVFLPVFFGGRLFHISALLPCVAAFTVFSFAASSIYCFNDIYDAEADKSHPVKCKRPIASDVVSVKTAYAMSAVCLFISLGAILFFYGESARYTILALILFYYAINLAYCVKLKHCAIVDVVIVSIGFVLRVFVGGVAAGIRCTEWMIIMTFLLALFLAFAKRRDDVVLYVNTNVLHRKNIDGYNLEFMNQVMTVVATVTVIAYIMYTLSPDIIAFYNSRYVYLSAIFVLIGIIRYLQITIVESKSGSPTEILLRDRFIQCCIAGWVAMFLIIIYSNGIVATFMGAIP